METVVGATMGVGLLAIIVGWTVYAWASYFRRHETSGWGIVWRSALLIAFNGVAVIVAWLVLLPAFIVRRVRARRMHAVP